MALTGSGAIQNIKKQTGYGFPLITAAQQVLSNFRGTGSSGQNNGSGQGTGSTGISVTATDSPLSGPTPLTVKFTSSVSGGTPPYSYSWDFGDGGMGASPNVTYAYPNAGQFQPTLLVLDSTGASSGLIYLTPVTVGSSISPLTIKGSESATSAQAPATVYFIATPAGGIPPYTFKWDFGDGSTSSLDQTSHIYQNPGTYTPSISVTDDLGNTAGPTSLAPIAVTSGPPPPPPMVNVEVTALYSGNPVNGASIVANGTVVGTTNSSGKLSISLKVGTQYTIQAIWTQAYASNCLRTYSGSKTITPTTATGQTVSISTLYSGQKCY